MPNASSIGTLLRLTTIEVLDWGQNLSFKWELQQMGKKSQSVEEVAELMRVSENNTKLKTVELAEIRVNPRRLSPALTFHYV